MKNYILLTLISFFGISAFASPLSSNERGGWTERIASQCLKNFKASAGDKNKACACAARNLVELAEAQDPRGITLGTLEYLERYYALRVSDAEMAADRFGMDDALQDVGECLKNANYVFPIPKIIRQERK